MPKTFSNGPPPARIPSMLPLLPVPEPQPATEDRYGGRGCPAPPMVELVARPPVPGMPIVRPFALLPALPYVPPGSPEPEAPSPPRVDAAPVTDPASVLTPTQPPALSAAPAPQSGRVPAPASAPASRKAARRGSRSDEVAQARAQRAQDRQYVEMAVENRLDYLERMDQLQIPRMFVVVTGNLASAAALRLIAEHSERAYETQGCLWVYAPQASWIYHSGLSEDEWIAARSHLREKGLIQERRRFDLDKGEIVTEYAFMLDIYSNHVSKVRVALRELAWQSLKATGSVTF